MTWFKIDDGFYDHPKFLDLSNAAVGLWSKAGAWCGKHLTDGVIPASKVSMLKGTKAQVNALLSSHIWVETTTETGAKAYRFHDWNDYQPTREVKLKERADSAERQRKSRERKTQEQEQRENVTRDSHVTGARDIHVSHTQVSQRPDPTRPDPTNKEGEVGSKHKDAHAGEDAPSPDSSSGVPAPASGQWPDEWCTPADPRCRVHAHWDRRDVPACVQCGNVRQWFKDRDRQQIDDHRAAVEACEWCDERGLVEAHDTTGRPVALQCDHTSPPPVIEADTTHQELTSAEKRRQLINQALGPGTPSGPF